MSSLRKERDDYLEVLEKIANYILGEHHEKETTAVGYVRMMNMAEAVIKKHKKKDK